MGVKKPKSIMISKSWSPICPYIVIINQMSVCIIRNQEPIIVVISKCSCRSMWICMCHKCLCISILIVTNQGTLSVSKSQANHLMNFPDHVLGLRSNTTPSLYKSLPLDMRYDGGGWLTWVLLVNNQDRMGWVPNPIGHVDHVLLCLLMIPILLCYLIYS